MNVRAWDVQVRTGRMVQTVATFHRREDAARAAASLSAQHGHGLLRFAVTKHVTVRCCAGRGRLVCALDTAAHRLGWTIPALCDAHDRRITGDL